MENLSIQNVLAQRNNYNLALPFMETQQINPFYKISVTPVYVDMNEKASHIFKVGSRNLGNRWEELYSLMNPFLQQLATMAGIKFAAGAGDVVRVDQNTWKASAYGYIRLPDGDMRTSYNFKVIDLVTEEKKYRLAYEEKAVRGISDYKAAEEAAKRYSGDWVETGQKNDKGYPIRLYVIAGQDRGRYVDKCLLDAMTQLRANAPQKAATGAIDRVIRNLLGIKGTYTSDELKKPFAVTRMSFSPDYNDPVIKQMLLQQAIQSVGNLFGNVHPVVQTISVPKEDVEEMDYLTETGGEPLQTEQSSLQMESTKEAEQKETGEDRTEDFRCDKCDSVIQRKVWEYSIEHYERPLCYKCQRIVRDEQRGGRR